MKRFKFFLYFWLLLAEALGTQGADENDIFKKFESRISKMEDDLEERVAKLEDIIKVTTLRSCSEYSNFGLTTSGYYMIDPDGPLIGQEPFQVLCNFTTGSTEVLHDAGTLSLVEHCHDPGCYKKEVIYINGATNEPVPLSQIEALIQLSDSCVQSFYYECILAPLQTEDIDYAFWTDRHGEKNTYFTGSNKGFHTCDCHFTNEGCMEEDTKSNRCNCDANLPTPLTDSGTITNMTALPITKLSFGGLTYDIQTGAFQLGNFKCFGKKEIERASSCSALKMKGVMVSGYYEIKKPEDLSTTLVFCDMTSDGYSDVPQIEMPLTGSSLGTIAAWISKPEDDVSSSQSIPDGWVFCNGSLIEKGIWAGATTPNLNSGHFLRGGDVEQQLETEEDTIQEHQHTDPGHSHSATSSSSSHHHSYTDYYMNGAGGSAQYSYCYSGSGCTYHHAKIHSENTGSASVSVSTTVSSHVTGISGVAPGFRTSEETRPKNMKISWIMRCW